jgi:hypothetical protein
MGEPLQASLASDTGTLAHTLEPTLIKACHGRLSKVEWFRSAWQAGGASTGFATFTRADGRPVDAVVKLPVGAVEYRWTVALGGGHSEGPLPDDAVPACDHTPRVLASGTELNGYDLAWIVVERLSGPPLSAHIDEPAVRDLLRAAVGWYDAAARARPLDGAEPPPPKDWAALLAKGRDVIHAHGIPQEQRWNTALKATQKALPRLLDRWAARPVNTWCHGDLHFGNAMRRAGPTGPGPACVLIDLALVHPGHWVEDAVYLERLYWAKPELLCGLKPVSEIARLKRERGLLGSEDYVALANIRRVLMAASVPAFLLHEGHPRYVGAALDLLERLLPQVAH